MIQLDNRRFIKAYKSFKGVYKIVLYYRVPYRNIFGKLCKKNVVAAYDYNRLTDDQNNFSIILKNLEFKAGVNQRCKRLDIKHRRRQKENYNKLK